MKNGIVSCPVCNTTHMKQVNRCSTTSADKRPALLFTCCRGHLFTHKCKRS